MAPLIQPGVCRFTINGTYFDRNTASILDMQIDTTGSLTSRQAAIETVAADILANYDDHILISQDGAFTAQNVAWVDLDSEDGSTGQISTGGPDTWPKAGGLAGDGMPGNVAYLVTKVAPGGGRASRNGRWYLAGPNETMTDGVNVNTITSANVTLLNTRLASFLSGITDQGGDVQRQPVVLRTRNEGTEANPDIVAVGYSPITALLMQPRLATQRRRLR